MASMQRFLCPDDRTLEVNLSGDLEAQYDSTFSLNPDGFAYSNYRGESIPFTPIVSFGATAVVVGSGGSMTGQYTKFISSSPLENSGDPLDIETINYSIRMVLGTAPTIGTGDLTVSGPPFDAPLTHDTRYSAGFAMASLVDDSTPANNSYYHAVPQNNGSLKFSYNNVAYATHSSPFAWAIDDSLLIQGTTFRVV